MNPLIKRVSLLIRYYSKALAGQAINADQLKSQPRYRQLHQKLLEGFQHYEPEGRDFLKTLYLRKGLPLPTANIMKENAAQWAAETVLIIEGMYEGKLHPYSFTPLIDPLEIEYYHHRMNDYLFWLFSEDVVLEKLPLPFFYQIATERFSIALRSYRSPEVSVEDLNETMPKAVVLQPAI